MARLLYPIMLLSLTTVSASASDSVPALCRGECVAIGEIQDLGSIQVTPLEILEDSRCPATVHCVWAGRLRIRAQLDLGHESIYVKLASDAPLRINAGQLTLSEIHPQSSSAQPQIGPRAYRLGFTFTPDNQPETDAE